MRDITQGKKGGSTWWSHAAKNVTVTQGKGWENGRMASKTGGNRIMPSKRDITQRDVTQSDVTVRSWRV